MKKLSLRDQRQQEFADDWLKVKHGILYLCPRFGKIFTTINILQKLKPKKLLIAYPDNKIKDSWETDFKTKKYNSKNVTYTTHLSLHKYKEEKYDLVVIDEIHLLSEAQIEAARELLEMNSVVLGLTGTMTNYTRSTLATELGLKVVAEYPMEQAVREGVIVDYTITVKIVPLDNNRIVDFNGKRRTEKKQYDAITWGINQAEMKGQQTMFLRLKRMRLIQKSIAKINATKQILQKYKDERVLVFCGITEVADGLGIPSYHSKSTEKQMFEDFANGEGKHMAVVKIGNTGVTYKPLNKVVINYFDSNAENLAQKINRCMAMEYDTPDKKAEIIIISSNEEAERNWLRRALEFFDKSKIVYEK